MMKHDDILFRQIKIYETAAKVHRTKPIKILVSFQLFCENQLLTLMANIISPFTPVALQTLSFRTKLPGYFLIGSPCLVFK
jgi:hypothetical protein